MTRSRISFRPESLRPLPALAEGARVIVAYSGGLDSTVLLHALAGLQVPALGAIHVHHGLQPDADLWVNHCARICSGIGVPLRVRHALIPGKGPGGPEARARDARYALLREAMRPGDLLVTAHHRDDQAETVLLRLLRGSGSHGLSAMRPLGVFGPGQLWRPLLDHSRDSLLEYGTAQRLSWIEDPHNVDFRYARSWLRAEVMPRLRQRWPQADVSLARHARLAAETAELLDALAEQDLHAVADAAGLRVSALLVLAPARRHNLLRHWLRSRGFAAPDERLFERIDAELLAAAPDASPVVRQAGCEWRRYRDTIFTMPPLALATDERMRQLWEDGRVLELDGGVGRLEGNAPPPTTLVVRRIGPGESFRANPESRHRSLKNLFQEAGLPPWLRPHVPAIEIDGRLACVPGVLVSREWLELKAEHRWMAQWHHGFAGVATPVPL